ncbi:MAG: bifunctional DNA-formamidopyrimidine glycosylase/DNA-(apurinic or apyrimidinic site) lyase [Candidatus Zixiibacteriota bacterium]
MPELPEVETVVRGLRSRVVGLRLGEVTHQSDLIRAANEPGWEAHLPGRRVGEVRRRGKYIILHLEEGAALVIHLRMTGRLWIKPAGYRPGTHDRCIISLERSGLLVLSDTRQFARVLWRRAEVLATDPGLARLGPDALDIGLAQFQASCRQASRPIKSFLLDQTRLAGIGNIYADESLFRAGIRPTTRASSVNQNRLKRLHASIRVILNRAIRACGTTFDTFSDLEGHAGGFGPRLHVYGREGLPCHRCGGLVRRVVVAGRGTHYCPRCQR